MKSSFRVSLKVWIGTGQGRYHITVDAGSAEHALTEAKRRATNEGLHVIKPLSARPVETLHV